STPIATGAKNQAPMSGNATERIRPAAIARARLFRRDTVQAYDRVRLVRDDASPHGGDSLLGTLLQRGIQGGLPHLVQGVDDLLAPADHVAGGDVGALQDRVEALSLGPA